MTAVTWLVQGARLKKAWLHTQRKVERHAGWSVAQHSIQWLKRARCLFSRSPELVWQSISSFSYVPLYHMIDDNNATFRCARGLLFRWDVAGMKNNRLLYAAHCLMVLLWGTERIKIISVIINSRFSGIQWWYLYLSSPGLNISGSRLALIPSAWYSPSFTLALHYTLSDLLSEEDQTYCMYTFFPLILLISDL